MKFNNQVYKIIFVLMTLVFSFYIGYELFLAKKSTIQSIKINSSSPEKSKNEKPSQNFQNYFKLKQKQSYVQIFLKEFSAYQDTFFKINNVYDLNLHRIFDNLKLKNKVLSYYFAFPKSCSQYSQLENLHLFNYNLKNQIYWIQDLASKENTLKNLWFSKIDYACENPKLSYTIILLGSEGDSDFWSYNQSGEYKQFTLN